MIFPFQMSSTPSILWKGVALLSYQLVDHDEVKAPILGYRKFYISQLMYLSVQYSLGHKRTC